MLQNKRSWIWIERWLSNLPFSNPQLLILVFFLFALAGAFVIPPGQSPDEDQHDKRAYLLSQGHWLLVTQGSSSSGGPIDVGLLDFLDCYSYLNKHPKQKTALELTCGAGTYTWTGRTQFAEAPGSGYYFPAVYIPQALAILTGMQLHLSVANTMLLARSAALTSASLILLIAVRLLTPPPLVVALLFLPMTLFQASCSGIDGLTNALTVLVISLQFRLQSRPLSGQTITLNLTAIICAAILAASRLHLMPLAILASWTAVKSKGRFVAPIAISSLLAVAGWTAYAATATVDLRVTERPSTTLAIATLLSQPQLFLTAAGRTLTSTYMLVYAKQFVGVLGWLDGPLPRYFYFVSAAVLASLAAFKSGDGTTGTTTCESSYLPQRLVRYLSYFLHYGWLGPLSTVPIYWECKADISGLRRSCSPTPCRCPTRHSFLLNGSLRFFTYQLRSQS